MSGYIVGFMRDGVFHNVDWEENILEPLADAQETLSDLQSLEPDQPWGIYQIVKADLL